MSGACGVRNRYPNTPDTGRIWVRGWRRWTGIEPAGRGSPVPAALKAVGPTRCPDTSAGHGSARPDIPAQATPVARYPARMKKLLLLAILVALGVVAARKLRVD